VGRLTNGTKHTGTKQNTHQTPISKRKVLKHNPTFNLERHIETNHHRLSYMTSINAGSINPDDSKPCPSSSYFD
jgi:hypothetical protein